MYFREIIFEFLSYSTQNYVHCTLAQKSELFLYSKKYIYSELIGIRKNNMTTTYTIFNNIHRQFDDE